MADNQITNPSPEEKDNGKKKKIIIAIIIAVILIAAAAGIYAAMNKDNGYVDIPVTEIVTDENGEAVTNAQGEVVTEVVTDAAGKTVTQRVKKSGTTTKSNDSNTQNNAGGNNNNNNAGSNAGGNSGNGSGSSNNQQDNTSNNDDVKPSSNPTDKPSDPPTEAPKNRKINVSVILPSGGKSDTLEIYADGELVKSDSVVLNGKTYTFTTDDKYKGDVKIEAVLKSYGTKASSTAVSGEDSVKIALPLDHVEDNIGIGD